MEYQKVNEYIELVIDNQFDNYTIEDILNFYHLGKKQIHFLRMNHNVLVNDISVKQDFNIILHRNDKLKLPIFVDEERDFIPQNIPIDILYEDDFVLIINKQAGIEVHPDTKDGLNTIANGVSFYYQQKNKKHRIRYIHRLDKDTTGTIMFVKNFFVHSYFDYLLMNKKIKREYYAIVTNNKINDKIIINKKIGRDRHDSKKQIISNTGKEAITIVEVLKRFSNYALVKLNLLTGRTHQIRVHLASINAPILGDSLYGKTSSLITRQALHASSIEYIHPFTFNKQIINAPIPEDMLELLK
ncbi:MAG TPA: RluA family pseudouridine synthase [Haloplasmataceae bacterium]